MKNVDIMMEGGVAVSISRSFPSGRISLIGNIRFIFVRQLVGGEDKQPLDNDLSSNSFTYRTVYV
jgi:hypothetical protein